MKIETYEHNGITVEIHQDVDPGNPRTDWDQHATMVCWHRGYNLGDQTIHTEDYDSYDDMIESIVPEGAFVRPLYVYEHGGITMRIGAADERGNAGNPFSCPWDSGQVGFIYITADKVRECMMLTGTATADEVRDAANTIMEGEVQEYDLYLTGQVYGYVVDPDGEGESCWGFFDDSYDYSYVKSEANAVAEHIARERAKHGTFVIG